MTPTQRKALEIIQEHPGIGATGFAELMWPDSQGWKNFTKKGNGSTRGGGMAVAGGCYVGKLKGLRWVKNLPIESFGTAYTLTAAGETALLQEVEKDMK